MARPIIERLLNSNSSAVQAGYTPSQIAAYEKMVQQIIQKHKYLKKMISKRKLLQSNADVSSSSPSNANNASKPGTSSASFTVVKPSTSSGVKPKSASSSSTQIQQSQLPSSSENSKKRKLSAVKISSSKFLKPSQYPRPAIGNNYKHLFIGANETLIPMEFYVTIPWYSYELSTRYLTEFVFENEILATHNLHGKKQLDRLIVEDIVTHVSSRCGIGEEHVVFTIAKICADFSKLYKAGLLKGVKPPPSEYSSY